jgi:DNA-binding beta-propeller fold protein YncE
MLRSISLPEDIGIRPGAFSRVVQFFTGKEREGMVRPYAVAADDGVIAVADPGLRAIHLFLLEESNYELIRNAGDEPFVSPVGLSMSRNAIYVADSTAGRVHILDRQGKHKHTITGLVRPTGIAFHAASGRLFITDTIENKVVIFDESGIELAEFGARGLAPGQFNFPTSLAIHGDTLLVNDTLNYRIQSFSLDGTPLSSFGEIGDASGQFALSKGLGADAEGYVYVADALSNYIQIFDNEGQLLLYFGGMGGEVGRFRLPAGICIYNNMIYVADSQNGRVQVFEYLGGEG